jgi:hypothetical protein
MSAPLWWVNESPGRGLLPGSNYGFGGNAGITGSATGAVQFRSPLDQARSAQGQLSQAEYPDGYLGNIIDRRGDKLVQSIQSRLTENSYQRGVHKGSRIDGRNYFWPDGEVNPENGLAREAKARRSDFNAGYTRQVKRFSPLGNPIEVLAHSGKTSGMATPGDLGNKMEEAREYGTNVPGNPIVVQDPIKVANLRKMLPRYGGA